MKDKISYLDLGYEKYPMCFNINVMEEIQEQYGSLEEWGNIVQGDKEPKVKDFKYGLIAMINEAIDIENENSDKKKEFVNSKQVGRIISTLGFEKTFEAMKKLTVNSTKGEIEEKNE